MDKLLFWQLIEEARHKSRVPEEIAKLLVKKLSGMHESEVLRWQQFFDAYRTLSNKNKLWAAAYVINGGCSDDGFDYFRGWLVTQGKDVFLQALAEPDNLANFEIQANEADCEDMLGVGSSAYFARMNVIQEDYDKFYEALDEHPLTESELSELALDIRYASDIDIEWNEDDLERLVPKLYAKFS